MDVKIKIVNLQFIKFDVLILIFECYYIVIDNI